MSSFSNSKPGSIILLLGVVISLSVSCINQDDFDFDKVASIQWDASYAFPILYGDMKLDEITFDNDEVTLKSNPDGLLYISYVHPEISDDLREHYALGPTSVSITELSPVTFSGTAGTDIELYSGLYYLPVNTSEAQLDSIIYNELTYAFTFNSTIQAPLNVTLTFPYVYDDGTPVSFTYTSNNQGEILPEGAVWHDILAITNKGPQGYNEIPVEILIILPEGASANITPLDSFTSNIKILNQEFMYISGSFLPHQLEIQEDFDFDIFQRFFNQGEYELDSGSIFFEIINEAGVKQSITMDKFVAYSSGNPTDIQTDVSYPYDIDYPLIPGDFTIDTINVTNSNEIINMKPDRFSYTITSEINKDIADAFNFVTDTSKMIVNVITRIPMSGYAKGIVLDDTATLKIDDIRDEIEVQRAILKTRIVNDFPVDVHFQVYMMNVNYQIIDSLFTEDQTNIVEGAQVDSDGKMVTPGNFDDDIELDKVKTQHLLDAEYLYFYATLGTTNSDLSSPSHVKFYDDYSLNIDLGIRTDVSINIDPNDDK